MGRARTGELPTDPDLPAPVVPARRAVRGRPRLHADQLAAVFVGGCAGGALRYAATSAWRAGRDGFPWPTLTVNVIGAFVLGVVVVLAIEMAPSRWFRPLLGTGFCGGLTTFSSLVVSTAQLLAHGAAATAAGYLAASAAGGLAAGFLGMVVGRAVTRPHGARDSATGGGRR